MRVWLFHVEHQKPRIGGSGRSPGSPVSFEVILGVLGRFSTRDIGGASRREVVGLVGRRVGRGASYSAPPIFG